MELALALTSGLLFWSGFAPLEFWVGPYLGAALLYRALSRSGLRYRFAIAALAGLAFFAPLLHWSGSFVGSVPWLALTVLQTGLFALVALAPRNPFGFAITFTLIELLRMKAPFGGFGWGRIGFTQVEILNHLYPIIGVTGISLLVLLLGALLNQMQLTSATALSIFILAPMLLSTAPATGAIEVVAVQGGVDKLGLDFSNRPLSVFNRHIAATSELDITPDLVIWPENSADIDPLSNPVAKRSIQATLADLATPILVGAVQRDQFGPQNVAILFNPDGSIASRYQKQDLAPFGEYMPLRALAEAIVPQARQVNDFQPGDIWVIHQVAGAAFTSPICFEVLDDDLIKSAARGVDFIATQTNNATFGTSPQATQQLQIIRARAAEVGREFAVVSTTGHTAKVEIDGSISARLPQFATGALEMQVGLRSEVTMATRLNSWHWWLIGVIALFARPVGSRLIAYRR